VAAFALGQMNEPGNREILYKHMMKEKDRVDVVRLGAAFSYDVLSGKLENLKTVEVLSKKIRGLFPRRTINKRSILDKVNEFYPKYHKTFLGY
jgi:hypothetical protein